MANRPTVSSSSSNANTTPADQQYRNELIHELFVLESYDSLDDIVQHLSDRRNTNQPSSSMNGEEPSQGNHVETSQDSEAFQCFATNLHSRLANGDVLSGIAPLPPPALPIPEEELITTGAVDENVDSLEAMDEREDQSTTQLPSDESPVASSSTVPKTLSKTLKNQDYIKDLSPIQQPIYPPHVSTIAKLLTTQKDKEPSLQSYCMYGWRHKVESHPTNELLIRAPKTVLTSDWQLAHDELKLLKLMDNMETLKSTNSWPFRQMRPHQAPPRHKTHQDYLLAEAMWMAEDFRQERRLKKHLAHTIAGWVRDWHTASNKSALCVRRKAPASAVSSSSFLFAAPASGSAGSSLEMLSHFPLATPSWAIERPFITNSSLAQPEPDVASTGLAAPSSSTNFANLTIGQSANNVPILNNPITRPPLPPTTLSNPAPKKSSKAGEPLKLVITLKMDGSKPSAISAFAAEPLPSAVMDESFALPDPRLSVPMAARDPPPHPVAVNKDACIFYVDTPHMASYLSSLPISGSFGSGEREEEALPYQPPFPSDIIPVSQFMHPTKYVFKSQLSDRLSTELLFDRWGRKNRHSNPPPVAILPRGEKYLSYMDSVDSIFTCKQPKEDRMLIDEINLNLSQQELHLGGAAPVTNIAAIPVDTIPRPFVNDTSAHRRSSPSWTGEEEDYLVSYTQLYQYSWRFVAASLNALKLFPTYKRTMWECYEHYIGLMEQGYKPVAAKELERQRKLAFDKTASHQRSQVRKFLQLFACIKTCVAKRTAKAASMVKGGGASGDGGAVKVNLQAHDTHLQTQVAAGVVSGAPPVSPLELCALKDARDRQLRAQQEQQRQGLFPGIPRPGMVQRMGGGIPMSPGNYYSQFRPQHPPPLSGRGGIPMQQGPPSSSSLASGSPHPGMVSGPPSSSSVSGPQSSEIAPGYPPNPSANPPPGYLGFPRQAMAFRPPPPMSGGQPVIGSPNLLSVQGGPPNVSKMNSASQAAAIVALQKAKEAAKGPMAANDVSILQKVNERHQQQSQQHQQHMLQQQQQQVLSAAPSSPVTASSALTSPTPTPKETPRKRGDAISPPAALVVKAGTTPTRQRRVSATRGSSTTSPAPVHVAAEELTQVSTSSPATVKGWKKGGEPGAGLNRQGVVAVVPEAKTSSRSTGRPKRVGKEVMADVEEVAEEDELAEADQKLGSTNQPEGSNDSGNEEEGQEEDESNDDAEEEEEEADELAGDEDDGDQAYTEDSPKPTRSGSKATSRKSPTAVPVAPKRGRPPKNTTVEPVSSSFVSTRAATRSSPPAKKRKVK